MSFEAKLTIDIPPAFSALLERFVVAAERIAAALEPVVVSADADLGTRRLDNDFIQQFIRSNAFARSLYKSVPQVDEAGAGQVQPSERRDLAEGDTPPAAASRKPASDAPPAAGESPAPTAMWTPERRAIVLRDYPAGVEIAAMHAALNALPGPYVKRDAIAVRAAAWQVRRPAKAVAQAPVAPKPPAAPTEAPMQPIAPVAPRVAVQPPPPPPKPEPKATPVPIGPTVMMSYASIIAYAKPLELYSETHGLDLVKVNARRSADGLRPVRIAPSRATA